MEEYRSAHYPDILLVLYSSIPYRNCRFHADIVTDVERVQEVVGDNNAAEYTLIMLGNMYDLKPPFCHT